MKFYSIDHEATARDLMNFNYPNQKIGVIAHIENNKNEILLQQRGLKSRDENGLFEDIGGKVDASDENFKSAIMREIREEAGRSLKLDFSEDSVGIYHCDKNDVNWVFIVYSAKYLGGEFKIMEPEKCLGYKFFSRKEALGSDLATESCKFLIKSLTK